MGARDSFAFPANKSKISNLLHAQDVHMRQGQKRDRARELRSAMTPAERALWSLLRNRQIDGHRFRRQYPIGPYIVDFTCLEAGLVIEADGGQHLDCSSDPARDLFLHRKGLQVLRFWNHEIASNLQGIHDVIARRLTERCPHPNPPP